MQDPININNINNSADNANNSSNSNSSNNNPNNNNKFIIRLLLGVCIAGLSIAGVNALVNMNNNTMPDKKVSEMNKSTSTMSSNMSTATSVSQSSMNNSISSSTTMTMNETTSGMYKTYSESELAMVKDGHKAVLFFNASWCPTCQSTVKDIEANKMKIDSKVHIYSVDYDSNTALRQKYGVTSQHTFVEVDKVGTLIKKTTGLAGVEAINNYLLK